MDGCSKFSPSLKDWYIVKDSFTNKQVRLKLEFENPIYVSSGSEPCFIEIKVRNEYIFQTKYSNSNVKMNFTTTKYLPSMAKDEADS